MTHTSRPTLAARAASLVAGLLLAAFVLAGCAGATPSMPTEDVFVAAPFADGESLRYEVVMLDGQERVSVGHGTLSVEVGDGRVGLRQSYTGTGEAQATDETVVWVEPSTFRPIEGEREIVQLDGGSTTTTRYDWTYRTDDGEPVVAIARDGEDERTLRLRDHHYDNESSLWLWRSVDLAEEQETAYVSVNSIERSQQAVILRIPQTEAVTVPAGEFQAYRLLLRTGRAVRTAWIEADAPHRVLRWDNGETLLELLPE